MATTNQFAIDRTKVWGMQLSNARDHLERAVQSLAECRGKMIQCYTNPADGASPNYTQLEAQFGIPAGQGLACFSELDSTLGALGHPDTSPSGQIDRTAVYAAVQQFINQIG